uniref:Uncharacterized protein n=1 Tax=Faecalibaculum rodentium TaxID=1702221 RepID=A0A140DUN3_9FIRM|nr:hypothetical protein AALO17_12260 [Faecalibaculum rodentium]
MCPARGQYKLRRKRQGDRQGSWKEAADKSTRYLKSVF